MGKVERKERSDKKKDVKPTIDQDLYECIGRISHITNTPIKNVGETFCLYGLTNRKVIELLQKKFRRDFLLKPTLYRGNLDLPSERTRRRFGQTSRITMRFDKDTYEKLADLAYALDMTISTATGLLLQSAVYNTDIVNQYISKYVEDSLDDGRKKQLAFTLKYVRKANPYSEDDITFAQLINYIMENFMDQGRNVKKAVEDFLDSYKE